jgi:hypothetical protein
MSGAHVMLNKLMAPMHPNAIISVDQNRANLEDLARTQAIAAGKMCKEWERLGAIWSSFIFDSFLIHLCKCGSFLFAAIRCSLPLVNIYSGSVSWQPKNVTK